MSAALYHIREIATSHLERDDQDEAELIRELEAIAHIAEGETQRLAGAIELRLDAANVAAFERGRRCRITFIRLARGEDGVYELYTEGIGEAPAPDVGPTPDVPLEER